MSTRNSKLREHFRTSADGWYQLIDGKNPEGAEKFVLKLLGYYYIPSGENVFSIGAKKMKDTSIEIAIVKFSSTHQEETFSIGVINRLRKQFKDSQIKIISNQAADSSKNLPVIMINDLINSIIMKAKEGDVTKSHIVESAMQFLLGRSSKNEYQLNESDYTCIREAINGQVKKAA